MLKFLFVISFIFIGLFSGCSSKQNITVVIQNNLEQDIYVPNLGLAMIDYGDDEKIYYLSPADDFNPKSLGLSAVAFFVGFINIIKHII